MLVASDFANVSIAIYYLGKMGNDSVVSEFHKWENVVQTSVRQSEDYKALEKNVCSDYDYKEKFAAIVQKHLYYALPVRYKTMTDEEYDKRDAKAIEHIPSYNGEKDKSYMSLWMDEVEESSDIIENNVPF